jgi:hypothetical protein
LLPLWRERQLRSVIPNATVRSEITRCREKIKKATEELNEEKIQLESKVLKHWACKLSLEKVYLNLASRGHFTIPPLVLQLGGAGLVCWLVESRAV